MGLTCWCQTKLDLGFENTTIWFFLDIQISFKNVAFIKNQTKKIWNFEKLKKKTSKNIKQYLDFRGVA